MFCFFMHTVPKYPTNLIKVSVLKQYFFFRQDFRIFPPSIIVLKMSIIALKMYRYSYTLIQTNYNIISHHDNTKYYYFFILTIT